MSISKTTLSQFPKHQDLEAYFEVELTSLSTLRLVSQGNYVIIKSLEGLKIFLNFAKQNKIKYLPIGWGANTLIPDDASDWIYIKLQFPFDESIFSETKKTFFIPASVSLSTLVKYAKKFGFLGWEVLTGIPASLGGAIFMNAGTKYGETESILQSVDVMNSTGELRTIEIDPGRDFAYRKNLFLHDGDIIVAAVLKYEKIDVSLVNQRIDEYLTYRKKTQPLASKNCGCVFKNPLPEQAGKLIDEIGLKGFEMGDLKISLLHANFIENKGRASYSDFIRLVEHIKRRIKEEKGIELELEVQEPK
ncbi:MAG: UDP-N-acetylmuramate dehydrogenase [Bacteriovoracaceae bacterium]|nr:UDP-N-acetylmuramate dehydrogenase [Bacteriovoracaceae bacterium]